MSFHAPQKYMTEHPTMGLGHGNDGSGLRADEWVKEIFSIRGEIPDKRLWEKLEEEYRERFGES